MAPLERVSLCPTDLDVDASEKRSHSGRCWTGPVIHQSPLARMQYEL